MQILCHNQLLIRHNQNLIWTDTFFIFIPSLSGFSKIPPPHRVLQIYSLVILPVHILEISVHPTLPLLALFGTTLPSIFQYSSPKMHTPSPNLSNAPGFSSNFIGKLHWISRHGMPCAQSGHKTASIAGLIKNQGTFNSSYIVTYNFKVYKLDDIRHDSIGFDSTTSIPLPRFIQKSGWKIKMSADTSAETSFLTIYKNPHQF